MSDNRILLVGSGQLGTRYLQGILSGSVLFSIDVLEPSDLSFEKSMGVISSRCDLNSVDIRRVSLDGLLEHYTVCIVATVAASRSDVIENIAACTKIKNWVIEKVLAQSEQQLAQIVAAVESSDNAWVNTPRRRTSIYRKLKSLLDTGVPITFHANFPGMGLGCNSIHFIDVVSWLVGSDVDNVTIKGTEGWIPSKRQGYSEFDGQMMVAFADGSELHINSSSHMPISVTVIQGERELIIDENKGIKEENRLYPGRVEYQSEMSFSLVEEILKGEMGDGLPTIQQSVQQHTKLFAAIRGCKTLQINSDLGIPIT